jgi:hypothetical protein
VISGAGPHHVCTRWERLIVDETCEATLGTVDRERMPYRITVPTKLDLGRGKTRNGIGSVYADARRIIFVTGQQRHGWRIGIPSEQDLACGLIVLVACFID